MNETNEDTSSSYPVANAHNEWDRLEKVIVGIVEGAMIPPWDVTTEATLHKKELWDFYREFGRTPWPKELIHAAKKDLDEFVYHPEAEGMTVRRPSSTRTLELRPEFSSASRLIA